MPFPKGMPLAGRHLLFKILVNDVLHEEKF